MKKKQPKKRLEPKTDNGKLIAQFMKDKGVKGNYKDYVIVSPDGLMHWSGTFQLTRQDNGEKVDIPAVALVHKRNVGVFFGPEVGVMFWKNGGRAMARL